MRAFNWSFSLILMLVGILNIILIHPVPGILYLLITCIYFPPINDLILAKWAVKIPFWIQLLLAIFITMFTLGVSDLGDMIDKL